jgi:hypothetical protein
MHESHLAAAVVFQRIAQSSAGKSVYPATERVPAVQTMDIMKIPSHSILLLSIVLLALAACKKDEPDTVVVSDKGDAVALKHSDSTKPDKVVVVKDSDLIWPSAEASIRSQIAAANSEDIEAYMSYVHPDSVDFNDARARARKVFDDNDLHTTLETLEPESVAEGEVKARFVQRTEKLSGAEFRNNRVSGVYVLRKDGGTWKILSTRVDKVDYLDQKP